MSYQKREVFVLENNGGPYRMARDTEALLQSVAAGVRLGLPVGQERVVRYVPEPEPRTWILCSERLPETDAIVWFARPQTAGPSIVHIGIFRHGVFRDFNVPGSPGWTYSVSHWMPCEIPEPPDWPTLLTAQHYGVQIQTQRVVIRDPKDPAVQCDCSLAGSGQCPRFGAGAFMLEGWPDMIVLCERCELNNHVHDP